MEPKKVLITGGAGYIGSHITELLIQKKLNIVIIDNLSTGNWKTWIIRSSTLRVRILRRPPIFCFFDSSNSRIMSTFT